MRKIMRLELAKSKNLGQIFQTQSLVIRVTHWGFAISMSGLLITGFELHRPSAFIAVNFGQLLVVHITFTWLALGFFAFRLADVIITKDTELIAKWNDFKTFPKLLAYYLFRRASPPPARKYTSGEKIVFTSWGILFLAGTVLGLASYWQGEHLAWVIKLFGGFQMLRWTKYAIAVYFSATISVHIYLSLTENLSRLQAIVTGYERKGPSRRRNP